MKQIIVVPKSYGYFNNEILATVSGLICGILVYYTEFICSTTERCRKLAHYHTDIGDPVGTRISSHLGTELTSAKVTE